MTDATHMCPACAAGVPGECETPEVVETTGDGFEWIIPCAVKFNAVQNVAVIRRGDGAGRPVLSPGEITDPTSTGRKRAAMLAPILTGSRCEWAGLRHAGGGVVPIAGCDGHLLVDKKGGDKENDLYQGDLHHGPDKNTINNAMGMNLHRICVNCVTAEMRLLTEDLRWVRADEIQVGDKLIGFSEGLGPRAIFEPAAVTSAVKVLEPSYRIYMKNGDVLTASHAHQWVAGRPSDGHTGWFRTEQFMNRYETMRSGHFTLRKFVEPWDEDRSFESGWLSGFLDGEGSLSGDHLSVSQTLSGGNEVAAEIMKREIYSRARSINRQEVAAEGRHKAKLTLRITSLSDIMRVLGQTRPERLLSKWRSFLYEGNPARNKSRKHMKRGRAIVTDGIRQEIDRVEYIGETEVYSISTTTKTYIVEGYLSHNCHHRWHAANDEFYDEDGRPGAQFPFLPVESYYLHDPSTLSSDEDYLLSEEWWSLPKKQRGPYPFAPDPTRKVLPLELDLATLSEENPFPDSPFDSIGES